MNGGRNGRTTSRRNFGQTSVDDLLLMREGDS